MRGQVSLTKRFMETNFGTDKPPIHLLSRNLGNSSGYHLLASICMLKYSGDLQGLYQTNTWYVRRLKCRSQHLKLACYVAIQRSALGSLLWICGSMPQLVLAHGSITA
jgi:hypothetical protein